MSFIHRLSPAEPADAGVLGGKGHGLVAMMRLGLPVPPGFVIATGACRAFLRDGRFPGGLEAELAAAVRDLAPATLVSVRSGAAVSMPGMMDTFLGVSLGPAVRDAVAAVFTSWHTPRATSYRHLHDIPHDLGTAVVVQAMVFGDHDDHSGSGVAFSRDPSTGAPAPYGEVLFGRPGVDVVSGRHATRPLAELADREPAVWTALLDGLARVERHYRDVCHVEFTFESGRLWFLQVRPGGLAGRAAVRVAVDLVDEQVIDRATAVRRVSPAQLRAARTPRISTGAGAVLARGLGASPGVATGRIAVTADHAARMAADGPVILVRPHTSPLDMHGLAAAAGIVTTVGGPTSHAAVVARSMGRPAVVGAAALTVDLEAACVRVAAPTADPEAGRAHTAAPTADPETTGVHVGGRSLTEGTVITIDGTGGEIVAGAVEVTGGDADPHLQRLLNWAAAVWQSEPVPTDDVIDQPLRVQWESFLDEHRTALYASLDDLTEEQARRRLVPSRTTLLGLVKHATFVEKVWFDEAFTGRPRSEIGIPATPDESFVLDETDTIDSVRAAYVETCRASREAASALGLDDVVTGNRRGPLPLRWIYLHLLRELAQHCGHAEILREQILAADRLSRSDWWGTVLDAPDIDVLARFYSELRGWKIGSREPGHVVLDLGEGVAYLAIQHNPDYVRPAWPAETGSQQMMLHLDFEVTDLGASVAHAVSLGAELPEHQPQDNVRVLLDPAGHPFCLYTEAPETTQSAPAIGTAETTRTTGPTRGDGPTETGQATGPAQATGLTETTPATGPTQATGPTETTPTTGPTQAAGAGS